MKPPHPAGAFSRMEPSLIIPIITLMVYVIILRKYKPVKEEYVAGGTDPRP
jgi:hypothetical protein